LTDALLLIARDLRWGRTKYPAGPDSVAFRVLELVANGSNLNRTLQGLEPEDNGYRLLKAALKSSLDSLTGAEKVDWMRGHTFNSIPLHRTMQTVEVNLERWRSTRGPTNTLHVFVNLPAFTLDVLDGTASLLTSRVIVGTPETPTPLLKSMIECIVVYPYWHVPRKIAVDEYLPRIQKDPTFLESHHFDILDRSGAVVNADSIDWQSFTKDYFPVVMRQREGPENSLGLIKFVFDNPYAVYLHDTNARSLFRTDRRAYSHGCVRVEKAAELAHLLLSRERQSKSDAIEGAMQAKQRLSIELPQPVPIIIGYYTCEVRNGKFHQYPDIYRLDELLINDMYSE
jgi:murein L,D-transpeptidase YcbB/YkuD